MSRDAVRARGGSLDDFDDLLDDGDMETCTECHGQGGYHDCGEDTCCCLDPGEITEICTACKGRGWV